MRTEDPSDRATWDAPTSTPITDADGRADQPDVTSQNGLLSRTG